MATVTSVGFAPNAGSSNQSLTKALGAMASGARFWNGLTTLVFAVLGGICFALIYYYGDSQANELGLVDITVLGFAALRLIHLITYDKIFDFARAAVMDSEGGRLRKAARGWRRAICELMDCLWCAGLWSALAVVTMYLMGSWGRLATRILAVAGIGSLLQVISKAIAKD